MTWDAAHISAWGVGRVQSREGLKKQALRVVMRNRSWNENSCRLHICEGSGAYQREESREG